MKIIMTIILAVAVGVVGKNNKDDEKKHIYLVDLAVEHATKTCRMLAREMKSKKGFKPRVRCDAFADQLEEFVAEGSSTLMEKVDQSMDKVMDAAYHMSNIRELRKQLKSSASWFLKKKKSPTERETQQEVCLLLY